MKKMSELMDELGFRLDGSTEVKKAFVKNLIKQAAVSECRRPQEAEPKKTASITEEQLSFFDIGSVKRS